MEVFFQWIIGFWVELWPFNRIQPWELGLLVICGKWTKPLGPGVYFRVPLLMEIHSVECKEQFVDLTNQPLQTLDEKRFAVSGALGYEIVDIKKLFTKVQDFDKSLQTYTCGEIAAFITNSDSQDVTAAAIIEEVDGMIRNKALHWGIEVTEFFLTAFVETETHFLTGDGTVGNTVLIAG